MTAAARTFAQSAVRSPRKRRTRLSLAIPAVSLALIAAMAALGPVAWEADPNKTNLLARFRLPGPAHPLGTDEFGRDLFARVMAGARYSLAGAMVVVAGSTLLGMAAGIGAGSLGGRWDTAVSRTIDALISLPSLVVAMGVVGVLGKSFSNVVLALILTGWPWYGRLYRAFVVKERAEVYVLGARAIGCSPVRIAWRHVLPNIVGPALVLSTVNLGNAILGLASLSFLGLGVTPPTAEWGAMVSDARVHFQVHPWLIVVPGACISITVVLVNLLGDALRDAIDPRRLRV